MKGVIKKTVLSALNRTINVLEKEHDRNVEQLRVLSNDVIEDVALYKDLDVISVTVLIYSIYKVIDSMQKENRQAIIEGLKFAKQYLDQGNFGKYNKEIKTLFNLVKESNAKVKIHFRDVMHAARIKKSAVLLKKGLSIGQAAGLMGLSNWDLQQYAGKNTYFADHHERIQVKKRLLTAMRIFGVK